MTDIDPATMEKLARAICLAAGIDPDRKFKSSDYSEATAPQELAWHEFQPAVRSTLEALQTEKSEFWPGFTVLCNSCYSANVHLDNSMGFSAMSGGWGSIDFKCQDCGASTEIVEA